MNTVEITSPLTVHEATRLKHAALGAAREAQESGNAELGESLMVRARGYNRVVRHEHRRKVKVLDKGAEYVPTPALPVPAVKDMQTVKAAELQEPVKLIARELGRMGLLKEWTIIGSANSDGAEFQPLCARMVGKSVRYMEPRVTTQTEARALAVQVEKERLTRQKGKRAAVKSAA